MKYSKLFITSFAVPSWPIQRSEQDRQQYMNEKEPKGYINEDLVKFIPFTSMCPDILHLRMRISNKLFNQVNMYCSLLQHPSQ